MLLTKIMRNWLLCKTVTHYALCITHYALCIVLYWPFRTRRDDRMPFDALTIAAVRGEIEQKAVGGRVQGVLVAAPLTIGLEIYRSGVGRNHLLLSAPPQNARV